MALDYLAYQSGPSVLEKAMSGYKFGAAQRQERELAAAKAEEVANQKAQFAQMQSDLAALSNNPAAGASDYSKMMLKYPTMAEHIKKSFDLLTTDQQQVKQKQAIQFYSALQGGQVDVARKLLETNIEASENAGLQQDAQASRAMLSLLETSPETAKTSAGLLLAQTMGEKQFGSVMEKISATEMKRELHPGEIDKQAADLNLTKAKARKVSAETAKLGRETQKLALELEAMKDPDTSIVPDPEKRFNMERSLANDYQKRSASIGESERNLDIIKASAADESGAGDIALVTSFMKMLDPGSVVRETEFATARDSAGLWATLKGYVTSNKTGEFLTPKQRSTFSNLAQKYMEAAQREDKRVRDDMGHVIKNYQLNEQNVFGERAGREAPGAQSTPEAVNVGGQQYSRPAGFTDEQWAQYKSAMGVQ